MSLKRVIAAFEDLGSSATEAAEGLARAFARCVAEFDVILADQKGADQKGPRIRKMFIPDKRVQKRGKRGRQGVRMELLQYRGEQT